MGLYQSYVSYSDEKLYYRPVEWIQRCDVCCSAIFLAPFRTA